MQQLSVCPSGSLRLNECGGALNLNECGVGTKLEFNPQRCLSDHMSGEGTEFLS